MKSLVRSVALAGIVATLAVGALAQERRYVQPRTAADKALPPFSGGVFVGNTFYLSGQIGHKDGKVPPDVKDEARLVLDIVQDLLKQGGLTMDDLVSVQIFCSDVSHYAAFNDVYRGYFKKEFPARAFLGSGRLLFDARFEVQGIAVKR